MALRRLPPGSLKALFCTSLCSDLPAGWASQPHLSTGLALYLSHKTKYQTWAGQGQQPGDQPMPPASRHRHPGQHLPGPACGSVGFRHSQAGARHACMLGLGWAGVWACRGLSTLPPWAYTGLAIAPNPSCSLLRTTWLQRCLALGLCRCLQPMVL